MGGYLGEKLRTRASDLSRWWEEKRAKQKELHKQRQEERETQKKRHEAFETLETIERRLEVRSIAARQLQKSFQKLGLMDGREFESFVGKIFRSLGHKVTLTKSTGDQGVDVFVEKDGELVAIQCKHLARPASNKPVQEVYAGARYYSASQAWVVAPAGYTEGAYQLADRLDVELYEHADIRGWIERINLSSNPELYLTEGEIHEALVEQHSEYLELLTEAARVRIKTGQDLEVRQRFEQTRVVIENRLEEVENRSREVLPKLSKLVTRRANAEQLHAMLAETQDLMATRRAEVCQATAFLDLAIQEDIFISNYVTNPDGNIRKSPEGSNRKVVLRPRIIVSAEVSEQSILELSKQAWV